MLKKIVITTFVLLICFLLSQDTLKVDAVSTINNDDFSQFVNLNKYGTYNKEIVVTTINKTDNYIISNELSDRYGEVFAIDENSKYKRRSDYAFKINGEFYTESVFLDKSGLYCIEPCFYSINNGVATPTSNSLEKFYIEIDLNLELKLAKNTFYYEQYAFVDDFILDIKNSFNLKNVVFSYSTEAVLKDVYNNYIKQKNNNFTNCDIESLNTQVLISFENYINKEFVINVKTVYSSEAKKIDNWEKVIEKVKPIVIDVVKFNNQIDLDITKVPIIYNELLNLDLNIPDGHVLDIKYNLGSEPLRIPAIYNTKPTQYNLTYELTNLGIPGNNYYFQRKIIFYNSNLVSDNEKPVFVFKEKPTIKQNDTNFDFSTLIEDVYDVIQLEGKEYKSYSNLSSNISYDISKLDISTPGTYEIGYSGSDFKGNLTTEKIIVEVVDGSAPKVLTKYNKMFINRFTKEFKDQIKIIDNYKVDDSKTEYALVETSENEGYIIVYAEDFHGNSVEEIIHFRYEYDLTFFQKFFIYPLYKIKEFFINLF